MSDERAFLKRTREWIATIDEEIAKLTEARAGLVRLLYGEPEKPAEPAKPTRVMMTIPVPESKAGIITKVPSRATGGVKIEEPLLFLCPLCDKRFRTERAMSGHKGTAHRPKGGSVPTWDVEKGKSLWEADIPTMAIARKCGVDRKTIQQAAVRYGWTPRGKGWRPPGKPLNVRSDQPKVHKETGRERIDLTRHSICGKFTTLNPCEMCHQTVAIGERGKL